MSQFSRMSAGSNPGPYLATLQGNSGAPVGPTVGGNIFIIGSGSVSVSGNPGTNTLTISAAGLSWTEVTAATQSMAADNGYIANRGSLITFTLPVAASQGSVIRIAGKGAGGWAIAQNGGQTIHFEGADTTTGIAGSLASTVQYDSLELLCVTTNSDWVVISSMGNITIV